MKVRGAREADAGTLLALRTALWPEREVRRHEREILLRAGARARHQTLLAEGPDGEVVGFAELTLVPGEAGRPARVLIGGLFVVPPARRQGVARNLLAAAEQWAHGRGASDLSCELDVADEAARAALVGLGFGDPRPRLHMTRAVRARSAPVAAAAPGPGPGPRTGAAAPAAAQVLAASVARPAYGPVFIVVNVLLSVLIVVSFAFTDIFSRDPVRGVLLPLLDVAGVVYFLSLFLLVRYRRRTDASARAGQLFRADG